MLPKRAYTSPDKLPRDHPLHGRKGGIFFKPLSTGREWNWHPGLWILMFAFVGSQALVMTHILFNDSGCDVDNCNAAEFQDSSKVFWSSLVVGAVATVLGMVGYNAAIDGILGLVDRRRDTHNKALVRDLAKLTPEQARIYIAVAESYERRAGFKHKQAPLLMFYCDDQGVGLPGI